MSLEQSVTALEQRNAELVSEVVRARDAVMGLSNMYTTITLGLAGTEDGQYFTVPGNGAYQKLYQHDGAQAPLIATYPSKEQANADLATAEATLADAVANVDSAITDHVAVADPHTQYADLAGGTSANFTAMPQVGGDPIVESGSNADGEWTRWADGTQITQNRLHLLYHTSTELRLTWTYPVSFIGNPTTTIESTNFASNANFSYDEAYHLSNRTTGTNIDIRLVLASAVASSSDSFIVGAAAIGRWK